MAEPSHYRSPALETDFRMHYRALDACKLAFYICSLRHTFATRFDHAKKDPQALKKDVLGLGDLLTVLRYVNDSENRSHQAIRIFFWKDAGQPRTPDRHQVASGRTKMQRNQPASSGSQTRLYR